MVEQVQQRKTRLTWHWWLAIGAIGWPLFSWLAMGGFSYPILISNVITTIALIAGTYIVGLLRTTRFKSKPAEPIRNRNESMTMFIWFGLSMITIIALCIGAIGTMLCIGGMSDLFRPTPKPAPLWNVTGYAVATGSQMIVACALLLGKMIPLAKRELTTR